MDPEDINGVAVLIVTFVMVGIPIVFLVAYGIWRAIDWLWWEIKAFDNRNKEVQVWIYLVDVIIGISTAVLLSFLALPVPIAIVVGGLVAFTVDYALSPAKPKKGELEAKNKVERILGLITDVISSASKIKTPAISSKLTVGIGALNLLIYDVKNKQVDRETLERIEHFLLALWDQIKRWLEYEKGQTRFGSKQMELDFKAAMELSFSTFSIALDNIAIAIDLPDINSAITKIKVIHAQMVSEGLLKKGDENE